MQHEGQLQTPRLGKPSQISACIARADQIHHSNADLLSDSVFKSVNNDSLVAQVGAVFFALGQICLVSLSLCGIEGYNANLRARDAVQ